MMNTQELEQAIQTIKDRNQRVEADKAWETSWLRRGLVVLLTYLVVVSFFLITHQEQPWLNALVPALAFVLSNSTLSLIKRWWLK